jgi:hypothetical protein
MSFSRRALQAEADARDRIHQRQKSSRPLSEDYSLLGVAGEAQFERDFKIPRDRRLLPGGDGRVDFTLGDYTFDPKVAAACGLDGWYILLEADKHNARIIVQGKFCEEGGEISVVWLGWEYSGELLACPVKRLNPKGPLNHFKPIKECRKMSELAEIIRNEKIRLGLVVKPKLDLRLAPGALCGSMSCNGCYDIGDDKTIHPPRPGYEQQQLIVLDGD